ncbi:MAG: rRNA maturation RNase YbeY [Acidimicrobiia bacterium]|nr:rRNA maturation RNase YbeY [Acidimicrobiia bacterium]
MIVVLGDPGSDDVPLADLESFVRTVLDGEGVDHDASVAIEFVDDAAIAALNETHMGKNGPTDVLSFPIESATPGHPPRRRPGGPPIELGDIFISTNVVAAHASEYEVTLRSEMYLMVCHGVLHLLGWDHQTDTEAEAMEAREARYLASVGIERR